MKVSRIHAGCRVFASSLLAALCFGIGFPVKAQDAAASAQAGAAPVVATAATRAPSAGEPSSYLISRGDELNLKFFYTPELNTIATVRSDGRIAVPLIGEIVVEGKSPGELATTISSMLSGMVKRPEVVINVQGPGSQRIFVGGEVTRPGVQPLLGPLTVVQAVMVAEGLKESAQPKEVVLIRRGAHGERNVIPVNLQAALEGKDNSQDIPLQPYDVVMVPRSGIANVNLWVDQYLRRNLPISAGLSYTVGGNNNP